MSDGMVRLMRGDCLRLMRRVADASVRLVLCDPPYGITDCDWDREVPYARMWPEWQRVLAPRGSVGVFGTCPNCARVIAAAPKGWCRYEWVWRKNNATGAAQAHKMPMRAHEVLLMFYPRLPIYNAQGLRPCVRRRGTESKTTVYGRGLGVPRVTTQTGWPKSVLEFPRERGAAPAQKPVAMLEYLIRTYTNEGDVVMDNTMGLGSAGVAAVRAKRGFVGMEIDRKRFALAKRRIEEALRG